jgi:hypothetical protein
MDTIGLDLHKRESQLCIIADDGTSTERRIVTSRERFTAVLGDRPRARILLEAFGCAQPKSFVVPFPLMGVADPPSDGSDEKAPGGGR